MKLSYRNMFSILMVLVIVVVIGCEKSAPNASVEKPVETPVEVKEETPPPSTRVYPMEVEALGTGEVKWKEEATPEGWTKVLNTDGTTLGYSKDSGLALIQVDGYAFKDLNKNGKLDQFEDWREDYEARAASVVSEVSVEQMMGLKMNPFSIGAAKTDALEEATVLALDLGHRHVRFPGGTTPVETTVAWNNLIQKYIEGLDIVSIPATFIADPLGGKGVSKWPGYLGIAATFDPQVADEYGKLLSKEWRALGVTMKVAPQIDLATDPRWKRNDMTFGEDPQLAMDMSRAIVNAWQSTYDENGNDLGWGEDSVNTQIKHFTGDGAAEGGRESHTWDGSYNVFPGGQFFTGLLPFVAALDLPGKTKEASSMMTNFSIAIDANGEPIGGDRTATSYNKYKIQDLYRGALGSDGFILTDFAIIKDGTKVWGVENLTEAERVLLLFEAGSDSLGGIGGNGQEDVDLAMAAYNLGVERLGQEAMDKIVQDSARRTLKTFFNVGVVDNPYLSVEKAKTVANNEAHNAAGFAAELKSIVMLKNSDNVIQKATDAKKTVYVPWKFVPAVEGRNGVTPAKLEPVMDLSVVEQYFNVVTDKQAAVLTGEKDKDGNVTPSEKDIVRATKAELDTVDFSLVRIMSPQSGNPTMSFGQTDYVYRPISLQYRPYTANSNFVRRTSIAGDIIVKEVQGTYGVETVYEQENRSYFGQSAITTNESDLDLVLYAASVTDKVVVAADVKNSMIFSEFEDKVDSILVAWGGDRSPLIAEKAFLEVISGKAEPSGLLPIQMPKDMDTVEKQYEDVPRDVEVHVDSAGNAYDFAFGMNWSGVIKDARTAKYNVPPIVGQSLD